MPNYEDDPTIPNDGELLRRMHPDWVVRDDNAGEWRPSSAAFENHPDGSPMSIYIGETLIRAGRAYEDVLIPFPDYSLAKFTAGLDRQLRQGVAREPTGEEPAHGIIFGDKPRRVRKAFARAAEWVRLRLPG
jgi:hypothetical protein